MRLGLVQFGLRLALDDGHRVGHVEADVVGGAEYVGEFLPDAQDSASFLENEQSVSGFGVVCAALLFHRFGVHGFQRVERLAFGDEPADVHGRFLPVPHFDFAKPSGDGHAHLLFDGRLRQMPEFAFLHAVLEPACACAHPESLDEMYGPAGFGERIAEVDGRASLGLDGDLGDVRP